MSKHGSNTPISGSIAIYESFDYHIDHFYDKWGRFLSKPTVTDARDGDKMNLAKQGSCLKLSPTVRVGDDNYKTLIIGSPKMQFNLVHGQY